MGLLVQLAGLGLVHCDLNEFNLLIDDEERITLIDFPQVLDDPWDGEFGDELLNELAH